MSDNTSILVAAIALAGVVLAAIIAGGIKFYKILSNNQMRLEDTKNLVAKYRYPLAFAAIDLQSRLSNILEGSFLNWRDNVEYGKKKNLYRYTSFLVGRYLTWAYIFRYAQFLHARVQRDNKLTDTMRSIESTFTAMIYGGKPFWLWRGEQMAIAELMAVKNENGEQFCIGFAEFDRKWDTDSDLKSWFDSLQADIKTLEDSWARPRVAARVGTGGFMQDQRLRELQHLLIDLVESLDASKLDPDRSKKCVRAERCRCSTCSPSPASNLNPQISNEAPMHSQRSDGVYRYPPASEDHCRLYRAPLTPPLSPPYLRVYDAAALNLQAYDAAAPDAGAYDATGTHNIRADDPAALNLQAYEAAATRFLHAYAAFALDPQDSSPNAGAYNAAAPDPRAYNEAASDTGTYDEAASDPGV